MSDLSTPPSPPHLPDGASVPRQPGPGPQGFGDSAPPPWQHAPGYPSQASFPGNPYTPGGPSTLGQPQRLVGPVGPKPPGLSRGAVGAIAGVGGFLLGALCASAVFGLAFVVREAVSEAAGPLFDDPTSDEYAWEDEHGGDDGYWGQDGGTIDDPWLLSDEVYTDEWSFLFDQPYEATAEILAHNDVNAPPADGMEYWIVPVYATYTGPSSTVTAHGAIDLWFVDAEGAEFPDGCGDVPDALVGTGLIGTDDSVHGNVCLEVPAGADGLWGLGADDHGPVYLTDPEKVTL